MNVDTCLQRCHPADAAALCAFGSRTYADTFASQNTPATMQAYLSHAFSLEKISAELLVPGSVFYFLEVKGHRAGYLKLNLPPAQSDLNEPGTLEIERLYLERGFQGGGLGRKMLTAAEDIARQLGCRACWLGVWEKNLPAIGFYERLGYREISRHIFRMGEELQSDLVMKKALE